MISRAIRFDYMTTQQERKRTDKLVVIRNIWEIWIENLRKLYNPGEHFTVNE